MNSRFKDDAPVEDENDQSQLCIPLLTDSSNTMRAHASEFGFTSRRGNPAPLEALQLDDQLDDDNLYKRHGSASVHLDEHLPDDFGIEDSQPWFNRSNSAPNPDDEDDIEFSPVDASLTEGMQRMRDTVGARRGRLSRQESLWVGDSSAFTSKLNAEWSTTLTKMESLDYDIVDNRVFREMGRHRSSLTKLTITFFIGISIGITAFLIEYALQLFASLRLQLLSLAGQSYMISCLMYVGSGLCMAVLAGVMTVFWAPAATGAGVALVMTNLNGINVPRLLETRTMFGKIFALLLSVPSGLPVGPEGPLVHIGAAISSFFTKQHNFNIVFFGKTLFQLRSHGKMFDLFHNDHDRRDFLSSGAASGLAAAFGAPIGGVLFSLEEASSFWNPTTTWRCLFCTSLATFILTVLHGGVTVLGAPGLIQLGNMKDNYGVLEIVFFTIEASTFGLIGAVFNQAFKMLAPYRPKMKALKILEIAVVVVLVNTAALLPTVFPTIMGSCVTVSEDAFENPDDVVPLRLTCPEGQYNDLALLTLGPRETMIKLLMEQTSHSQFFTAPTLAINAVWFFFTMILACDLGLPAGLFMPNIFLGASLGALQGLGFKQLCLWMGMNGQAAQINTGLYALVGATSMLAGVFRSAISLVVIMLEGTGNVQYLLPLLVGVATAKAVGNHFNISIYDMQIEMKKFPFLHSTLSSLENLKEGEKPLTAEDIMAVGVVMFQEHEEVGTIEQALHSGHNGFPVVHSVTNQGQRQDHFRGLVTRQQLLTLLSRREFHRVEELSNLSPDANGFVFEQIHGYLSQSEWQSTVMLTISTMCGLSAF